MKQKKKYETPEMKFYPEGSREYIKIRKMLKDEAIPLSYGENEVSENKDEEDAHEEGIC